MIDASYIDQLRARVPVSTVVARRVKLSGAGREWRGLSPFNKERSPSFFVNDQKGFYHDFSSGRHGDIFAFVMETEGVAFPEAVERVAAMAGIPITPDSEPPAPTARSHEAPRHAPGAAHNVKRALELWAAATGIAGTAAEFYLSGRGLVLPPGVDGRVLRFHPRCPWRTEAGELIHVSALLGLYRDIHSDEPTAILRRGLTPDGRKLGKPLALGPKAGCAVKLTYHADVEQGLHVGEGIETTIAGMMLGFAPAWALGDTGNLRSFPALAGVDALTILVDHDANQAGQAAASECFDWWTEAGREVVTITPAEPGADMNNVIR